jgi:hypothetical protein
MVGLVATATACGTRGSETAASTTSTPASSATAPTTAAESYQPTLLSVQEKRGSNSVNVQLPQITGGSAAVRDRFNNGMRTALDDLVGPASDTTVEDGMLAGDERSKVTTVTPHVVAGVAVFTWYGAGAAHANNSVATITIDAGTAQPILLKDVFTDRKAAAERLSATVTQVDNQVGPLTPPSIDTFLNWVPTAQGFRTYVPVAHALGDYYPVTVPWGQISDLMTPAMRTALSQ